MSLLGRVAALGSGMWLRQVLRSQVAIANELKQVNASLGALVRAVERLVPPAPDTTEEAPSATEWIASARDDDQLREMYALREELATRWNRPVDEEEAMIELDRRAHAAREAEEVHAATGGLR